MKRTISGVRRSKVKVIRSQLRFGGLGDVSVSLFTMTCRVMSMVSENQNDEATRCHRNDMFSRCFHSFISITATILLLVCVSFTIIGQP